MPAIAARELLGRGVRLQPGETIHYVITDAAATLPEDRVQAATDNSRGYDAAAYEALLLKAGLVLLSPLGLDAARLDHMTDPASSWDVPPNTRGPTVTQQPTGP